MWKKDLRDERDLKSDGHGRVAAVHDHFVACDEGASFVGGKEEGSSDKFVGFPKAIDWSVAHDGFNTRRVENFLVLFRREEAWDEGVDPDFLGGPFSGEVLGEIVDSTFGGTVGEDAGEGVESGNGTKVDDVGRLATFDEVLAEDLAGEEDGLEVDVHNPVQFVGRDFEEGSWGVDAGSVD